MDHLTDVVAVDSRLQRPRPPPTARLSLTGSIAPPRLGKWKKSYSPNFISLAAFGGRFSAISINLLSNISITRFVLNFRSRQFVFVGSGLDS